LFGVTDFSFIHLKKINRSTLLLFIITGVGPYAKADDVFRSIDKSYCDTVLNFLVRLACQVNDPQVTIISPGESLSRR